MSTNERISWRSNQNLLIHNDMELSVQTNTYEPRTTDSATGQSNPSEENRDTSNPTDPPGSTRHKFTIINFDDSDWTYYNCDGCCQCSCKCSQCYIYCDQIKDYMKNSCKKVKDFVCAPKRMLLLVLFCIIIVGSVVGGVGTLTTVIWSNHRNNGTDLYDRFNQNLVAETAFEVLQVFTILFVLIITPVVSLVFIYYDKSELFKCIKKGNKTEPPPPPNLDEDGDLLEDPSKKQHCCSCGKVISTIGLVLGSVAYIGLLIGDIIDVNVKLGNETIRNDSLQVARTICGLISYSSDTLFTPIAIVICIFIYLNAKAKADRLNKYFYSKTIDENVEWGLRVIYHWSVHENHKKIASKIKHANIFVSIYIIGATLGAITYIYYILMTEENFRWDLWIKSIAHLITLVILILLMWDTNMHIDKLKRSILRRLTLNIFAQEQPKSSIIKADLLPLQLLLQHLNPHAKILGMQPNVPGVALLVFAQVASVMVPFLEHHLFKR